MYKKLLALSLALVLCVCPVFAVSDADNSYYSFEPVSYGSLGGRSVSTLAASSGWSDTDHDYLNQIRLALTSKNTGTLLSYIIAIKDSVTNSYDKLFYIKQNTDYLQNINNNGNSILSYLRDDINGSAIRELLTAIKDNTHDISSVWTATQANDIWYHVSNMGTRINDFFNNFFGHVQPWPGGSGTVSLSESIVDIAFSTAYDRKRASDGSWTLYHYVKQLSEVLASDDDKALADAQKSNRQSIEKYFLSGGAEKTSLTPSHFWVLSSAGGTVKDLLKLNGHSSVTDFISAISDSDEAGQGWFSAETRDALDSVSSSSSYGLKREKGNSDIYNMAGFSDHYSWLYGD